MRHAMMIVVGVGLVWASTEACFARGPQGGGQGNAMQMQARHRYGGQCQGMGQGQGQMSGQGQMMGRGQMMGQGQMPQNANQVIGNANAGQGNAGQGNAGNGVQQRKRDGNYQGAAKLQAQNRAKQQKKTQVRKQDGKGQD